MLIEKKEMVQHSTGFYWRKYRRIIPLEIQLGLKCGSWVAYSLLMSLIICLKKFEEETTEDLPVFRHTDEKVDLSVLDDNGENEDNERHEIGIESEDARMAREFLEELQTNAMTENTTL